MPTFHVQITDTPEGPRVAAFGHLDMATGPKLREALAEAEQRQDGNSLVLDYSGLEFLDSTGLAILLDADVRATQRGRSLVVVTGDGEARRLLDAAGVADRLTAARIE